MPYSSTIKDVASAAGVSIGTVSNVLHGKATMYTPETAARVEEAVRSTGYRPNHVARSLVNRRTQTFGVFVRRSPRSFLAQPYYIGAIEGLVDRTAEAGYHIKVILDRADLSHSIVEQLEDGSMDGVAIIAPRRDTPVMEWVSETSLATVITSGSPDDSSISRVDVDDGIAVYEAVCWMIAQGHRRIGLIAGPPLSWSAARREEGYRRALQEEGIIPEDSWRYQGDYSFEGGRAGAIALMQVRPSLTALVCGNDRSALAAIAALQQSGLRVPEDISVLGFDDIPNAAHAHPPLTTIHHPVYEIGVKAAEVLLDQVEGRADGPAQHVMRGTLVVRESIAPPPQ